MATDIDGEAGETPGDSLCARCAQAGRTCCQTAAVFLTKGDVRRIAAATALDEQEFATSHAATEKERKEAARDTIWSRTFDADGRRRILRHTENGDCLFLAPTGCRLALDVRPLVCRLYPYEYTESSITGVTPHLCPYPESANPPLLLALLAMNHAQAEADRQSLYNEITNEFPPID